MISPDEPENAPSRGSGVALNDVIVVGGGPAGLSAAMWAGRYRRSVVLFDAGEQRNRWADESHGYFGFDCVDPGELLGRARGILNVFRMCGSAPCESRLSTSFKVASKSARTLVKIGGRCGS